MKPKCNAVEHIRTEAGISSNCGGNAADDRKNDGANDENFKGAQRRERNGYFNAGQKNWQRKSHHRRNNGYPNPTDGMLIRYWLSRKFRGLNFHVNALYRQMHGLLSQKKGKIRY